MAVTVADIQGFKDRGERFVMVTAYDYPSGRLVDRAGVPVILVGDTLADNVLGYPTTVPVTLEEMIHHTRAVVQASQTALVVGDMPFGSYQASLSEGVTNAGRLMKEAGCHAVKFEGPWPELVEAITRAGMPVMGHLGLTPQSVHAQGYRVQARTDEAAARLLEDARRLQTAGVFALVLECIPGAVATEVTAALSIPTIGIGAGPQCDAQVLVLTDLLGLSERPKPKFVKRYAEIGDTVEAAVVHFREEVEAGAFPDDAHAYH
jgi:3-methyl-2-oxobutanoate hydroxymethyltransferase